MNKQKVQWLLIAAVLVGGLYFLVGRSSQPAFSKSWQEARDFELMMGKESGKWQYVKTREDRETLGFFKRLYEKNFEKALAPSEMLRIPQTLHFIWLGPNAFPEESLKNLSSWIEKHPSWTVKFWTDIDRAPPHHKMQKILVQESHLPHLLSCYYQSDNFGERSELLRYEILHAEGGLYVDHDVLCKTPFDALNGAYDFYCGLEELAPSVLSSSIFPSTHLIGSKPQHPVLSAAMDWVKRRWQQLDLDYPGTDSSALLNRIKHRSFSALSEGIHQQIDKGGSRDIVLPASFFSQKEPTAFSFALHAHEGTWMKLESAIEKKLIKESTDILNRVGGAELLLYLMAATTLLLSVGIFLNHKRSRYAQ